MKRVLITGATGYIGRRLKDRLLNRSDLMIRLLVRNRSKVRASALGRVEVVEGDSFNKDVLYEALSGIDVAFYLIHSMGSGHDFERRDRVSAENFREACIACGVRRIVYLGGLGVKETASRHLLSRMETGEILSARPDKVQTLWIRAGVIIGSGSTSFEIIRNLVQKLPVMFAPRWVNTKTQAIAVRDVLAYLCASIDLSVTGDLVVDIGTNPMRFRDMVESSSQIMGLRRTLIPIPLLSPRMSSYWLMFFTPIPHPVAMALIEGLKSETLVLNSNAADYFPHIKPLTFDEAMVAALAEIEENQVISRWCDSSGGEVCDIKDQDDTSIAVLHDSREFPIGDIPREYVFESISSLGGEVGWFAYNMLWQIRGLIDKFVGGYGLNRGRRVSGRLRMGDALDFWKVVDIKENKRVLLLAQMKLPGKAWLEFDIRDDVLVQTAHFYPHGLLGRAYWNSILPMHHLIFDTLGKKIVEHAAQLERET